MIVLCPLTDKIVDKDLIIILSRDDNERYDRSEQNAAVNASLFRSYRFDFNKNKTGRRKVYTCSFSECLNIVLLLFLSRPLSFFFLVFFFFYSHPSHPFVVFSSPSIVSPPLRQALFLLIQYIMRTFTIRFFSSSFYST